MHMSLDELRNRTVIDAAGLAIGHVEAVFFDSRSWQVDAIRVSVRREMTEQIGAEKSIWRRATIDVPTEVIQSIGDAVLLHVRADELGDADAREEAASPPTP
ncbi:MAG: PRC-barrel domain-containing protein [Deltaproteobacteria bacterium]|nr:PRC-barrel domain-containing protein [Kofleriaceae bacterium]